MRIATFNVNGVNGRLAGSSPLARGDGARCRLPAGAEIGDISAQRCPRGGLRGDLAAVRKAGTGSPFSRAARGSVETRRALPGDEDDAASRYIEAAVDGLLIGCLYVPNGNPAGSEKFGFKLRWFERLIAHARRASRDRRAGRARRRLQRDADRTRRLQARTMGQRRAVPRRGARRLSPACRAGLDGRAAGRSIRASASTPSGTISGTPMRATPACASTICCSARPSPRA